jgi:hypothetical protein
MNQSITFRTKIHFSAGGSGRKQLEHGETPTVNSEPGRMPWVSKFMALAIRFDGLLRDGVVTDQAELSRLGHVSRARVTQIMNLLHLAPDIQEELLFLPLIECGRDSILERHLRPIAAVPDWRKQRRMWKDVRLSRGESSKC